MFSYAALTLSPHCEVYNTYWISDYITAFIYHFLKTLESAYKIIPTCNVNSQQNANICIKCRGRDQSDARIKKHQHTSERSGHYLFQRPWKPILSAAWVTEVLHEHTVFSQTLNHCGYFKSVFCISVSLSVLLSPFEVGGTQPEWGDATYFSGPISIHQHLD